MSSPDQGADAARFHAKEIQASVQRDERAQAEMLSWVRRIVRRILGRQAPPESPLGFERATDCLEAAARRMAA